MILECEFYLLENMDCCLVIFQPYRPLVQYCQVDLNPSSPANRIQEIYSEVLRFAFFISKLGVSILLSAWVRSRGGAIAAGCPESCLLRSRFLGRWCSRPRQLILRSRRRTSITLVKDLAQTVLPLACKVGNPLIKDLDWSCRSCGLSAGSLTPLQIS